MEKVLYNPQEEKKGSQDTQLIGKHKDVEELESDSTSDVSESEEEEGQLEKGDDCHSAMIEQGSGTSAELVTATEQQGTREMEEQTERRIGSASDSQMLAGKQAILETVARQPVVYVPLLRDPDIQVCSLAFTETPSPPHTQ